MKEGEDSAKELLEDDLSKQAGKRARLRKVHQHNLKVFIKNHVPLHIRQAEGLMFAEQMAEA